MFITTHNYAIACDYWRKRDDIAFGVYEGIVTVCDGKDVKYDKVYYIEVNDEDAFYAKLTGCGVGDDPFSALTNMFNTTYVLYKSESRIHKAVRQ